MYVSHLQDGTAMYILFTTYLRCFFFCKSFLTTWSTWSGFLALLFTEVPVCLCIPIPTTASVPSILHHNCFLSYSCPHLGCRGAFICGLASLLCVPPAPRIAGGPCIAGAELGAWMYTRIVEWMEELGKHTVWWQYTLRFIEHVFHLFSPLFRKVGMGNAISFIYEEKPNNLTRVNRWYQS